MLLLLLASPGQVPLLGLCRGAQAAPGDQPTIPKVLLYGPLDNGGVAEEAHHFLRTLPEVLQCMDVM